MQELLHPEGVTNRGDRFPTGYPIGADLVVLPRQITVRPRDVEVVTADLFADLYDPSLVISHGYVGPERRRSDRSAPVRHGLPAWLHRAGQVVLLTVVVVVPLTMIAARSVPPATGGTSPVPATGQASPKPTAAGRHHAPHVFTATSQQVARAEAAYQRALARVGASGGPGGPGTPPVAAAAHASQAAAAQASQAAASEATVQQQAAAVQQQTAQQTAQEAAQQAAGTQAAATQAAAAQARTAALAAAAQRRAARAAARAQVQAARSGARGAGGVTGTTGVAPPAAGGTVGGPPPADGGATVPGA